MDFGITGFPLPGDGQDVVAHFGSILDRLPPQFTTVWLPDHLQWDGDPFLEAWTWLAYLAGAHPRFRYGHLVLAQSYRNPGLVAKMAATLDALAPGRVVLGLGAGWKEDEYRAYGYEFPSGGTRVAQLGETIELIRALWETSPATYEGTYYRVVGARCEPRPQQRIPILVGTSGPKALRIAARLADMWNWDGPWSTYRVPYEILREACRDLGRPFEDITLTAGVEIDFRSGAPREPISLGPSPDDVIRELIMLEQAGVSHVQVTFAEVAAVDQFVERVLPAFEGR
jgi:alkanesulfonate monooxygenase SsuD/methylene tetrahydromethanopterin reductase-like flavin-dependent oxidoreductase (luciferase family)